MSIDFQKEYNLPFKKIAFMKYQKVAFVIMAVVMLLSALIIAIRGFNLGLDFTGGAVVELVFSKAVSSEALRELLTNNGFVGALVQTSGSEHEFLIRLPASVADLKVSGQVVELISANIDSSLVVKSMEFLGPKIGDELSQSAIWATLATLAVLLTYIGFRFELRLAVGAVVSLFHDILITLGVFSLFQIEIDLNFVAAILSVVGYSLNDSVIVFDRIRENFRKIRRLDEPTIVDISITQILSRSIMTSISTILVLLTLLLLGGSSLHGFAVALLVGISVGTFSSIYMASGISLALGLKKEHMLVTVAAEEVDEI